MEKNFTVARAVLQGGDGKCIEVKVVNEAVFSSYENMRPNTVVDCTGTLSEVEPKFCTTQAQTRVQLVIKASSSANVRLVQGAEALDLASSDNLRRLQYDRLGDMLPGCMYMTCLRVGDATVREGQDVHLFGYQGNYKVKVVGVGRLGDKLERICEGFQGGTILFTYLRGRANMATNKLELCLTTDNFIKAGFEVNDAPEEYDHADEMAVDPYAGLQAQPVISLCSQVPNRSNVVIKGALEGVELNPMSVRRRCKANWKHSVGALDGKHRCLECTGELRTTITALCAIVDMEDPSQFAQGIQLTTSAICMMLGGKAEDLADQLISNPMASARYTAQLLGNWTFIVMMINLPWKVMSAHRIMNVLVPALPSQEEDYDFF
eukprot:gene15109-21165_t